MLKGVVLQRPRSMWQPFKLHGFQLPEILVTGEFWELKSIDLKIAKVGHH